MVMHGGLEGQRGRGWLQRNWVRVVTNRAEESAVASVWMVEERRPWRRSFRCTDSQTATGLTLPDLAWPSLTWPDLTWYHAKLKFMAIQLHSITQHHITWISSSLSKFALSFASFSISLAAACVAVDCWTASLSSISAINETRLMPTTHSAKLAWEREYKSQERHTEMQGRNKKRYTISVLLFSVFDGGLNRTTEAKFWLPFPNWKSSQKYLRMALGNTFNEKT